MIGVLLQLALVFGGLSVLAVGGVSAVTPDIQRAAVSTYHWMSNRDFLDLFAISRVAPGPGSLLVTVIGQRVAGIPGAVVATVATYLPPCIAMYIAARFLPALQASRGRRIIEGGLAPLAVGLNYAAGIALARGTDNGWQELAITALATLALSTTRLHPMLVMGAGAVAGWALGL